MGADFVPPFSALAERLVRGEAVVAGVLSGTSADGIDVVLVRPASGLERLQVLAFETRPFPAELELRVRALLDGVPQGPAALALLHRDLGLVFGRAARELAREQGLALDLVGSHGQTVWHHDGQEPSGPASLQLGDGDFVAESAGCAVVSDFRQRDLAAGGEGAPLVALVDELLFPDLARPAALLNLGGMANLSLLGPDAPPRAFDTGPAGALLDGLARRLLGRSRDEDGEVAARGQVAPALVDELLGHPFLDRSPPKSTGRDTFGEAWVEGVMARATSLGVRQPEDLLASANDFVAAAVALALQRWGAGEESLVVAGGGVHNAALLDALARRSGLRVESSARHGVDPDAREALAFAALASRALLGIGSSEPAATGARKARVLGKLSPAPPQESPAST